MGYRERGDEEDLQLIDLKKLVFHGYVDVSDEGSDIKPTVTAGNAHDSILFDEGINSDVEKGDQIYVGPIDGHDDGKDRVYKRELQGGSLLAYFKREKPEEGLSEPLALALQVSIPICVLER